MNEISGVNKDKCILGKLKERCIHAGVGEKIAYLADALTGTPFEMTTLTVRRDSTGQVTHFLRHSRSKAWPASESLIEFTGKGDQDKLGKIEGSVYDLRIPETRFLRDCSVSVISFVKLGLITL